MRWIAALGTLGRLRTSLRLGSNAAYFLTRLQEAAQSRALLED
jgi:hypothetical protein